MSTIASLAAALADSAFARWLQAGWAFPAVESIHIVSFALGVGAIAVVDLRMLGLLRHQALAPLLRSALPVAGAGFAGAAASGAMLFAANATDLVGNPAFGAKLVLLAVAGLNAVVFHARVATAALESTAPPPAGVRAAGAASLLAWIAVVVSGRLIAYV